MSDSFDQFPRHLLDWYQDRGRDLPWRCTTDPYPIWVSEIMLQQTRVVAVIDYYHRFLEALPTIAHLAQCEEEKLLKLWQGLGYYNRVRNLQKGAQQIMERHGGQFPTTYEAIRALAGIGDYTAGAIASIAFGLPHAAVDGNLLRVISRITADPTDITTQTMKKRVTAWVETTMPPEEAGNYNQALMELGATLCLPNGAPKCDLCPVGALCQGKALWQEIPYKPKKKPRKVEHLRVFFLFSGDNILLRKRPSKGLLAGLWEFPHAPLDQPPPFALDLSQLEEVATGKHIFTHIEWHMVGVRGELSSVPPAGGQKNKQEVIFLDNYTLVPLAQLEQYAIPSAFAWALSSLFPPERGNNET